MDCRRHLRLGSAVFVIVLLCASATRAQEPSLPVFASRPEVGPLQCPSQASTTPTRPPAPSDRIPSADDLAAGAVELLTPRSVAAPKLPAALIRGFNLSIEHDEPMRVAFWGDSHVAAGYLTDELVKYLDTSGYAVATRVIPASVGRPGVRLPLKKTCKGGEWKLQPSYISATPMQVGPSLANLRSGRVGDYLWLDFRYRPQLLQVRSLQIHALPTDRRTAIGVRIDDGPEVRVDVNSAVINLRASSSISTLKLRVVAGEFVLQHLTLEYVKWNSIELDVFGLPSATIKGWANADVAYLKRSIAPDAYEAIVLEYGTNEGAVDRFNPAAYAAMLGASLKNMRMVLPHASCVLMGPTDRGMRMPTAKKPGRPDLMYYARVHQQITRIQGEVGATFGCALWDWQRYMGGPGSMYLWARETPPLAAWDLIHLTQSGYRRTASGLAQSLGWLEP